MELEGGNLLCRHLIGLKVVDADDPEKVYGTLTQVSSTGANDVYHITLPRWQGAADIPVNPRRGG